MQAYIMLVMASAVLRFAVLSMCMQPCIRAIGFEELLGKRCRVSNRAGRQEQQQQPQPLLTGLSGLGRLHLQAHCRLWCRSGCQLLHRMPLRPLQKCCCWHFVAVSRVLNTLSASQAAMHCCYDANPAPDRLRPSSRQQDLAISLVL